MDVNQQLAPTRPALSPAPSPATPIASAAAPAPTTTTSPAAPQAPMKLEVAKSVYGFMADGVTVNGATVPSTAGPTTASGTAAAAGATGGAAAGAAVKPAPPSVSDYSSTIDKQLKAEILANQTTRGSLDKEKASGAKTAGETEQGLNGDRQHLLDQLNQRSGVYDKDIGDIDAKLGKVGKTPTPEQKALIDQKNQLLGSKNEFSAQQTALSRWHDRNQINDIDKQLTNTALSADDKKKLLAQKRQLATGLLSTVKHYEQFADPWGKETYGPNSTYSSIKDGGCGPTALADLMDFKDQEDPEGHHSRGQPDPYTPLTMAKYASTHGRVKGEGTDGSKMMEDLSGSFAGVKGNSLGEGSNLAAANASLDDGVPVLFSGHNVHGTRADGQDTKYGAHFMVLSGVSEDHQTYNVTDGGRNSAKNIRTMSKKQVGGVGGMYNLKDSTPPATRPNS